MFKYKKTETLKETFFKSMQRLRFLPGIKDFVNLFQKTKKKQKFPIFKFLWMTKCALHLLLLLLLPTTQKVSSQSGRAQHGNSLVVDYCSTNSSTYNNVYLMCHVSRSIWSIFDDDDSSHWSTWAPSGQAPPTSRPSVPWEHWGPWGLYEPCHDGRAWE